MASFDPSIISQIPDYAGNPMEARAKGYKLADLITEQQRNKLLLGQQQEQIQEQQKARDILKNFKGNIGSAEGNIELAQQYGKAGLPKQSMEALQFGSEQQTRELQQQELKIRMAEFFANDLGPAARQVKQSLRTPQDIPQAQQLYKQNLQEILQKFPEGQQHQFPAELPADFQQANALLDRAIAASTKATQAIQREEQTKNIESEIKSRGELRDIERSKLGIEQQKLKLAQTRAVGGLMDEEDIRFGAQQYLAGDRSVFQNLGRGTQGPQNIVAMRHAIREEAQARGMTPQDVATKIAEFNGLMSEERALGTRQAAIETAATEAQKVVPIALKASEAVPRGSFVPLTKLIQKGQVATSNPALARFAQANLTLANVYARAMSPTGVPTVSGREHALDVLGTATSPEAYRGVVDIILQEIEAARTSPSQVRQDIRSDVKGGYKAPAPGPAAGSNPNDPLGIR